jgi:hypothetical protein
MSEHAVMILLVQETGAYSILSWRTLRELYMSCRRASTLVIHSRGYTTARTSQMLLHLSEQIAYT